MQAITFYKLTDWFNGIIVSCFELISYGRLMGEAPPWAHLRESHGQYKSSSSRNQLADSALVHGEVINWHKPFSQVNSIPNCVESGCKIKFLENFLEIIPRDKAGRAALRLLGSCTGPCRCSLISGSPRLWLLEEFLGLSILEPSVVR